MSARLVRLVCIAATAATTVLAPLPAPATAAPDPDPGRSQDTALADLLTDLQGLYKKAEKATDAYNATEEKLKRQRAESDRLDRALARARLSLHDSRSAAGRLARQQYQSSTDISPYVRLLMARDPQHAMEQGHVIGRLARERAGTVDRLTGDERRADDLARKARAALDRQLALAERRKKERDAVRGRLHDVEDLLASLDRDRLTALAAFEEKGAGKTRKRFLAAGAPDSDDSAPDGDDDAPEGDDNAPDTDDNAPDTEDTTPGDTRAPDGAGGADDIAPSDNRPPREAPALRSGSGSSSSGVSGNRGKVRRPSAAGDRAVRYAVRQLGKPYEWGAEGPASYDCSGLTSRAWAKAGTPIPRTSQEQWRELKRIPLDRLRPGDLVVYFPKATHVALYLGDGMVVQAPRPGAKVKVSPLAANPILGAVRPDPDGKPLRRYEPPELPEGALNGSDEGYDGYGYAAPAPETSAR
ncbi:C40 family peptidase [Streptomyces sp. NPDC006624]|uniref:C40 family peptidase n=1 Tax=Streptomyces sp. NPDC006624 TaxID=3154892 RepID=UPI0033B8EFEB